MYEDYVRPVYSKICPICTRLTGIVQDQVAERKQLPEAILDFLNWVGDEPAVFYSWSDNDSRQLRGELQAKGVSSAIISCFDNWVDFQKEYSQLVNQSRMGLDVALSGAGLQQIGSKHSAASDALSSVQLLKLAKSPQYFEAQRRENIIIYTRKVRLEMQQKKQENKLRAAARSKAAKEIKNKNGKEIRPKARG